MGAVHASEAVRLSRRTLEVGECRVWSGSLDTAGYGLIRRTNGSLMSTHRLAYELANGPIPHGALVCHRCDNPPCCRPEHLFLGDYAANAADMVSKGRAATGDRSSARARIERRPRGERHPKAVLTAEHVIAIRARRAAGEGVRALGREFGVSHNTIVAVVQRRSWHHVA